MSTAMPDLTELAATAPAGPEHLPGAVNLPGRLSAELAARLAPDRARTVITYCSGPSCGRSKVAAAGFIRLGYADVRVYHGGKADRAAAGLPFAHIGRPDGEPT
ncbi:rhodanese-like domain-containing protein [Amorphoplanes digitatis]|uniref:Rhodanese-related sulfurtransferase n=1 Tax=Actinoplanes digitatis TaxID=1868 RepID=A0A7W7MR07_9ACTN|nr:rhodanese-like domain-containing protein [Actinoplanes digitatis]MBB4762964.1 rhodanese-related sulfurtransferase [Actinoplanes digitatis]BFE71929.1 hypothetical protein GCM10020092_052300 [Actinoplanes digitatis]GID95833.1 hypothetical protein Adi01nite_52450 [Actinoplanes digitatis]